MYYHLIPLPFHLVLIGLYLAARNRNDLKKTAIIQPAATFVALIIAGLSYFSPISNWEYTIWILIGMGLCFLADIFNIDMSNDKILYAAIGVFLIAYLEYAAAFTRFNGFHSQDWIVGGVFLLIYIFLMRLYWQGLGNFKIPILIYGLVMPFSGDALYGHKSHFHLIRCEFFSCFSPPGQSGQHDVIYGGCGVWHSSFL